MSGTIYLLQNGGLARMDEAQYDSEAVLQKLLADHPDLLAGDQLEADEPRRWLLVSRETGVPGGEGEPDRWSLDHLFLDQDAVPTLVEVKRSSDTRLRREVVGQMLDYAANAVAYWPVETLRALFDRTWADIHGGPAEVLKTNLGVTDAEAFWPRVESNLRAGRIRMMFVADVIPPELRRVVEFLNGQMQVAEVLAVEVKQFSGEGGLKTFVPRLVAQKPKPSKSQNVDEATFLAAILQSRGAVEHGIVKGVVAWSTNRGVNRAFTKGPQGGNLSASLRTAKGPRYIFSIDTQGKLWLSMRWLRESEPFNEKAKQTELWERLNAVPGVIVPLERIAKFPVIPLADLAANQSLAQCLSVFDWLVDELTAVAGPSPA